MSGRTGKGRKGTLRIALLAVWIVIVVLVVLWESIHYRGIVAVLGEWQYDTIGVYYPALTCVVLILLLSLPGYALFPRPALRGDSARLGSGLVRSARLLLRTLMAIGGGLALLAAAMIVAMLLLPRGAGPVQKLVLDRPMVALPTEGPTEIDGAILYERTAAYNTSQLITRRNARYAPIVVPGVQDRDLRFFVELPPVDSVTRRGTVSITGILKRNALPGEIADLYRYAGYRVEQPLFVLYPDAASLRRPYLVVAAQLAIAALLVFALAALQWRRLRRLTGAAENREEGLIAG